MYLLKSICIYFTIIYIKDTLCVDQESLPKYFVDQGDNLTIPCPLVSENASYMWHRKEKEMGQNERLQVGPDGSLFLSNASRQDSGIYNCSFADADADNISHAVRVIVRTPPPPLKNVRIHPSTILALILWDVEDNGGYPIIDFTAEYRAATDDKWLSITPVHIAPNSRQIDVYKLEPNTTYVFRIWARNQLGQGDITIVESQTRKVYEEAELARHFLAGAENFDTRVWVLAVGIVMGTLTVLGLGTCYLLYLECRAQPPEQQFGDEQEIIELVPNIILNPGFDEQSQQQAGLLVPADENSNSETTMRLNNNTVIQPRNV